MTNKGRGDALEPAADENVDEKVYAEQKARTRVRRWISGLILAGIVAFVVPGVDAFWGLRPGMVSAALFALGFVVACYSFVRFGPRSGT
ncbi:MAG: hypothetical protein P8176_07390 [Gammaproteobacteria bacterium]